MASSTKELEELQLYYFIFPTKLLPEEEYTPDDLDIGFTCSSSIARDISDQLTKHLSPTRWECRNLGSLIDDAERDEPLMTPKIHNHHILIRDSSSNERDRNPQTPDGLTKEQIMDQYNLKEEDIVKPVGRWKTSDQRVWITAKLMSALELVSVYEIRHEADPETRKLTNIGYTNNHGVIEKTKFVWRSSCKDVVETRLILVNNKEELEKLQEGNQTRGHIRPFDQKDKWITEKLYDAYKAELGNPEAYRRRALLEKIVLL